MMDSSVTATAADSEFMGSQERTAASASFTGSPREDDSASFGGRSSVGPRGSSVYSSGSSSFVSGTSATNAEESWEFTVETAHGGSSSLRRSSAAMRTSGRKSTSGSKSKRLSELTVNKLQFGRLGHLYGREKELERLTSVWQDVCGESTKNPPSASSANPSTGIGSSASSSGPPKSTPGSSSYPSPPSRRFVTIHGASGTGKSSLAESIRSKVLRKGGLYLQGKFPQQMRLSRQALEPYAAFISACHELCDLVMCLGDPAASGNSASSGSYQGSYQERFPYRKYFPYTAEQLKLKLEQDLGKDKSVLMKVVPGLAQILEPSKASVDSARGTTVANSNNDDDDTMGYQQLQHQFKFAFRKFVRALTGFGPVVLVLDDLQWADVASMDLVESLLTDRETTKLMIIGSYRDDELYQHMPHLAIIRSLTESSGANMAPQDTSGLCVDAIPVGNLDALQVNELLVDLLSAQSSADTLGLAECVHKKTHGNVFFVIQFLTLLQESELLDFNFGIMRWRYDVPLIQLRTAATENVVGLMYAKMKGLPDSIGRALPILACLGSSFTASVFDLVARRFQWKDDLADKPIAASADINDVHGGPGLVVLSEVESSPTLSKDVQVANEHSTQARGSVEIDAEEQASKQALTGPRVLEFCEAQGLIESAGDDGGRRYQWVHDKIQEAAITLISEDELNSLKLQLGEILFHDFDGDELERHLFVVANLLNTDTANDPLSLPCKEPVHVANLYLRAGVKAMENAAFDQASGYLSRGIGLLPKNHWQDHYVLSLELFSSAAEANFCTGSFESMKEYCDAVIRQGCSPILDKRRVYMVLIDATGAAGKQLEALNICREVLAKLGHRFPNRAVTLHVLAGIVKIKSKLKKTTSHELVARLPTLEDPAKQWAMAMIDKTVTWAYHTQSDILPLSIFKGLQMTMKEGVSVYSPIMFVLVGFLLSGVVFDFQGGAAFGDQAIELLKKVKGARKVESRVQFIAHSFSFCWVRPISLSIKPLIASYETGLATGDTESASFSVYFALEYQFRTGTPLATLIADCAFYAEQLREVKMFKILALLKNLWQSALFLSGVNEFDGTLTGEIVQQAPELAGAGDFHDYLFLAIHRSLMYVQFALGKHRLVYESIKKTEMDNNGYEKGFPGIAGIYHLYAFNGLSMIALYREAKEKQYLKLAKKFASKIKSWAAAQNPNVTQYDSLLNAELESLRGATYSATKLYETAIVYSGRRGLTQDRALAHELLGEHYARLGNVELAQDAEFHLGEAIKLYGEWGAHAKVRLMKEKHEKILSPPSEIQIECDVTG